MITFEEVKEEHLRLVKEIYSYYIFNSTATFHKIALSDEEIRSLVIFNDPKYKSYMIRYEGILCGYVLVTQFKPRQAFVYTAEVTLYLKHGYEGKGIGKEALRYIEEYARTQPIHTLIALICGENTGSIKLFEKAGYKKCAHYEEVGHKFERWLDLVAYQKMLDNAH